MKKWDVQIFTFETVTAETEEEAILKVQKHYNGNMNVCNSFNFHAEEIKQKEEQSKNENE